MSAEDDSRNAVNAAFRLINAGQFDQAESVCRAHLNDQPEDINILGLLGAVLLKLGYTDEARETLEKTIRLEPAFPKPYEDLGALFLKQGDAAKAREFLEQSIELGGDQASAFFALANACHQLGDAEAAAEAQRKYMALSPIAQTLSKAEKLLENGKAEEAEKLCEAISREHPTDTKVLRLLARIASESGRPVVA